MHAVIGSGAVGSWTARALADAGRRVRIVSRSGRGPSGSVDAVAADVLVPAQLRRALEGAEVVYQCAQPAYHRWSAEFPPLQNAILEGAAAVGARVVITDNLYGYGPPEGTLTEHSPAHPTTRKGRLRLQMAQDALAFGRRTGTPIALLRPANYYGPDYDQMGKDVFARAQQGKKMRTLGSIDQPHSFSYVPDVGRAMAALGLSEDGWGAAWIGPVQPALTQREFAAAVWSAAGRTGAPAIATLSPAVIRAVGLFSPTVRELGEMLYEFTEPFVADSSRFERTFGVTPTDFDVTIRETLAAYPG